jgi:hypothetical protein
VIFILWSIVIVFIRYHTLSIKQTEVMYQPTPEKPQQGPVVTVKDRPLVDVNKFTYLGSTRSSCVHIDDEINAGIEKASTAFGRCRSSALSLN